MPIPLDLTEMGLPAELAARVVANSPCPTIKTGPGRVVLTTVSHLNNDVHELTVVSPDGSVEAIRPTGFHKFYRPIDGAWVAAKELHPGDGLEGANGPVVVHSVEKLPGAQRVYNMTVEGEHVYRVSLLGTLVHNNCPKGGTYRLKDNKTGEVVRVGHSNNLVRRKGEYGRDPFYKKFDFEEVHRVDDYATRRGLEQELWFQHNDPPFNFNRPIRLANPNLLRYLKAANDFLDAIGE